MQVDDFCVGFHAAIINFSQPPFFFLEKLFMEVYAGRPNVLGVNLESA